MPTSPKYFDPRLLNKIAPLSLRARRIVEGFLGGQHRSPYRGISVEFSQHREYVPGDDIKHLDWKVLGKSDRYYVKEFEVETNLTCHLFLDCSESMSFTSGEVRKFDYAATAAAALAYLAITQRDLAGLTFFDKAIGKFVPPGAGAGHLANLLEVLESAQLANSTQTGSSLHALAERLPRRGIVIVFSDLLDDVNGVLSGLEHLRHKGHDVIVFHILDRAELEFPFERMTLFDGMEGLPNLMVDPKDLRESYLAELNSFLDKIRKGCFRYRIDYAQIPTDTSLDAVLVEYLGRRAALAGKKR